MKSEEYVPNTEEEGSVKSEPRSWYVQKLLLLGVAGLAVSAFGTYSSLTHLHQSNLPTQTATVVESVPFEKNSFRDLHLETRAAYVIDILHDTELFSLNAEVQLPLASITKLMTALVVSEKLSENSLVRITSEVLLQEGDSGFTVGEQFRVRDLLAFTLIESSNDGAYALASAAGDGSVAKFVEAMNVQAKELGLSQTYFLNPTGLDTTLHVSGGYGSARDTAALMAYLLTTYPQMIGSTRHATLPLLSETNGLHNATNTNTAVGAMMGLIASKTGLTDLAGGNLVIAFDVGLNHPIVAVVLGSTEVGRFRDMKKLISAAYRTTQTFNLENGEGQVQ